MITNDESAVSEMKEIKVRLWGTDIGIGISRCTAIVSSSFMPSNQPAPLAVSTGPPTFRDKKKNDECEMSVDNEILPKKGSSSSAGLKRKRKAVNLKQPDELDADCMYELLNKLPLFDSETGEGDRPTVSALSLPPFSFNHISTSSTLSNSYTADGTSPLTERSSENQNSSAAPPLAAPLKKKNGSVALEAISKFWKTIENENYFQPFSRKTHRMDDLALKGGDYCELCEMTSSLYIPQWAADNGNYMPRPSIDDSEDCSDGNVPILIDLKGPVQCLADGAGAGAAALGSSSGSGSGSGSGSCPSEHMDALKGDFCSQFLLNSAAERPNIDFLYQRIIASFVLACPPEERACPGITKNCAEVLTAEAASRSSSSPSISSISTNPYSDATTADSVTMTTQDTMASIIEIESSAGLEDKSSNSSIHTEMEPEPEPDSVTDNNSTEIQESMDTGSLAEVASDVLNPVGIDYINIENISKFNENGFEKKPPDIGHCQLSWKEPDLNSKFITFCPDNLPPDSRCSSGHEKCHALFGLTRAQRTVIELAEAGLLHAFDCDVAFYREGAVESDEGGNVYSEEGSDVRTSPREAPYVTRDWSMLTARLEKNRVDDDICLTIRYVVEDLKEEELRLNARIAALRKILDDPCVAQEAETKRRSSEANRLLIARWQKLRKKGKPAVKKGR